MWNVLTRILNSNILLADIKAIASFSTGNVGVKVVHTGRETKVCAVDSSDQNTSPSPGGEHWCSKEDTAGDGG